MKYFNLLLILCAFVSFNAFAQDGQTRYIDEIFDQVEVQEDIVYAANISILTGEPMLDSLRMDVYTPVGDTLTNRPLMLYFHTGSFLPQYLNGQVTGSRKDSTVVEICKRLARRGYVAASVTYRQGWLPTATEQDVRTGSLLQAAYRGVLDAKACNRFFRMTVDQMDNPFGINVDRIACWGQGTGGYITLGQFLDDYQELELDKFIDSRTLENYIDTTLLGNVDGTNQTPLNVPNHLGYPNDFSFVVNMGGAMGDIGWLNGDGRDEPQVVCFHPETDPFAPFGDGAVIVPVTNQFVVNVSGGRTVVRKANATGVNAALQPANEDPDDVLNQRIDAYNQIQFNDSLTLAEDNFYPFLTTLPAFSGPWEWWGFEQLQAEIDFINSQLGTDLSAEELDASGKLTNPQVSKEFAIPYIDTLMNYVIPRAYLAMDLGNPAVSTDDILTDAQVELQVFPNPASNVVRFNTSQDNPILDMGLYNLDGRQVGGAINIRNSQLDYRVDDLPEGLYIARLRFENGILSKKILISRN